MAAGATEVECTAAGNASGSTGIDFITLDVRDSAAMEASIAGFEHLDVLVNAGGVIRRDAEHDPEVFAATIAVNLTGTMRARTAAKAKLASAGGCVVNIASMFTFFGGARVPGYAASKGGVGQLTKSLAAAWAGDGIRANAVAPGWISTPLTQALENDPERAGTILARTPMGRWGTLDKVAAGIVFLASPVAQFVTGSILPIDGGYLTV